MRILIDECIDERFRTLLNGHDCQTVRYAGLAGRKNGELLNAAEAAKFNVFLTVDQGIEYTTDKKAWIQRALALLPNLNVDPTKRVWTFMAEIHDFLQVNE